MVRAALHGHRKSARKVNRRRRRDHGVRAENNLVACADSGRPQREEEAVRGIADSHGKTRASELSQIGFELAQVVLKNERTAAAGLTHDADEFLFLIEEVAAVIEIRDETASNQIHVRPPSTRRAPQRLPAPYARCRLAKVTGNKTAKPSLRSFPARGMTPQYSTADRAGRRRGRLASMPLRSAPSQMRAEPDDASERERRLRRRRAGSPTPRWSSYDARSRPAWRAHSNALPYPARAES